MTVAAVLGHNGKLGRVVARRWAELGAAIITTDERDHDAEAEWAAQADLIVNCARGDVETDAVLPHLLAARGRLIQPSTDAIDEKTPYAAAKRYAEKAPGAVVIRCGLVGSWPLPEPAYTNWHWNGITTLAWANLAWFLARRPGLHIPASDGAINRAGLGYLHAETFGYPPPATARAEQEVWRVQEPTITLGHISTLLAELKAWG